MVDDLEFFINLKIETEKEFKQELGPLINVPSKLKNEEKVQQDGRYPFVNLNRNEANGDYKYELLIDTIEAIKAVPDKSAAHVTFKFEFPPESGLSLSVNVYLLNMEIQGNTGSNTFGDLIKAHNEKV